MQGKRRRVVLVAIVQRRPAIDAPSRSSPRRRQLFDAPSYCSARDVDPRTGFASLPLIDGTGRPLYSAIVVASDTTCGGCDNNDSASLTPDGDAINARKADLINYFNAGGGILALAGADNRDTFYQFLPVPVTAPPVTAPFTFTAAGLALGLIEGSGAGSDDNCCATHNSFNLPAPGSILRVLETDSAGLAETLATGPTLDAIPTDTPTLTSTPTPLSSPMAFASQPHSVTLVHQPSSAP